jgi:hypothetical protein
MDRLLTVSYSTTVPSKKDCPARVDALAAGCALPAVFFGGLQIHYQALLRRNGY